MTTPSSFSGTGLSIDVRTPYIQGADAIGNYAQDINSYTHTISASGGYLSATFNTTGSEGFAEDWLQNGLGRHITVYGPSVEIVWEGFVNQLDINMGGVSFSRGPLTNLCNRSMGWYTPIYSNDTVPGEVITGTAMPTSVIDNEDSKLRYGIWEKIVNIGEPVFPEIADYINELYLEENCNPEGFPSISLTNDTGEVSINVQCRGYIDWLDYVWNYNEEGEPTWVFVSDKIKLILADDPNDIISTSYEMIDFNGVAVFDKETDNRSAYTIIEQMLTYGGGTDDRWTFGIYANRKPVFQAIPTDVEYIYYKNNRTQAIETVSGVILDPWNVLPCKWVAIPDILSSAGINISYPRDDPRVFFAEEVTYTAPDQVTISGAKVRRLEHYLAKLGLGAG